MLLRCEKPKKGIKQKVVREQKETDVQKRDKDQRSKLKMDRATRGHPEAPQPSSL